MRHEGESREFEDDGGYLDDSWAEDSGSLGAACLSVRESFPFPGTTGRSG
jgi:hypothetical protein